MFTGIIETLGTVKKIEKDDQNLHYYIHSSISQDLKIDQSVSHNGVCLTVVGIDEQTHKVTAIHETLVKSNLGELNVGDSVNLERCTIAGARLDGHIVQGHVDATASCIGLEDQGGSIVFTFRHPTQHLQFMTVEKGSIAINGISLTVVDSKVDQFSVAIIPYTLEHTNLGQLKVGDSVNIEFDIIGKYVNKIMALRN